MNILSELAVGRIGIVVALDLPESVQNHLMHMGFVPEARVVVLRRAPAGDPTVYAVDGMEIALRRVTAAAIRVRLLETNPAETDLAETNRAETNTADTDAAAKSPLEEPRELTGARR